LVVGARRPGRGVLAARLARPSARLAEPPPWPVVLSLYDWLLQWRDDPVVRVNRAVAVAEVRGPAVALAELDALDPAFFHASAMGHAVRADLLRRLARLGEAAAECRAALAQGVEEAERRWLEERLREVQS
jgi:RNA polymerase sigma-70 factor (ECF subfamily)